MKDKINISIEIEDHEVIKSSLLDEKGRLKDSVHIGKGIELTPLFTAIKTQRAVGTIEVLSFILSIPVGVATGVLANLLYDWLKKNKVSRILIKKTEITFSEEKEKTIKIVIESFEKEN